MTQVSFIWECLTCLKHASLIYCVPLFGTYVFCLGSWTAEAVSLSAALSIIYGVYPCD